MTRMVLNRRQMLLGTLAAGLAAPALSRAATPLLRVGAILPLAGRGLPEAPANLSVPADAARMGLILAADDLMRAAPDGAPPVTLMLANAPEAGSARRAAERLVERDGATVLIGGFATADALAIAAVARQAGALFVNIAAPAAALQGNLCPPGVLHVDAGAATYLAALADTHMAQGHRRWHLIHQDDADARALLAGMQAELAARSGAQVAGVTAITADPASFAPAIAALRAGDGDIAVLLTDWLTQLSFLARAEAEAPVMPVTGFPWAATQTRDFYNRCRQIAPTIGTAARVALWDARVESPAAAALNADFMARWRRPMDPSGWAGWAALRLVAQATGAGAGTAGSDIAAWLSAPGRSLAADKDAGLTVDPADAQLRQPLFAVSVDPAASPSTTPQAMQEWARLLGRIDDPRPAAAVVQAACTPGMASG